MYKMIKENKQIERDLGGRQPLLLFPAIEQPTLPYLDEQPTLPYSLPSFLLPFLDYFHKSLQNFVIEQGKQNKTKLNKTKLKTRFSIRSDVKNNCDKLCTQAKLLQIDVQLYQATVPSLYPTIHLLTSFPVSPRK